ncbi:MAG: penicillin-binding protein 1B [Chromatiaceae bacterium]|nr:MAG: penicillin-binding protein 1B [Chromatiaceae bacterium]
MLLRGLLVVALAAAGAVFLYGVHLDRTVRAKFEGQRWALPARVFARPLELFVGKPLSRTTLIAELERLRYRTDADMQRPGAYRVDGERVRMHTRAFRFWDGSEPEQALTVSFTDGRVAELRDTAGHEVDLVRLDPALIASIYPTHYEDRVLLTREQLPPRLVETLLAVEDRNFYRHHGIDPRGIVRAAYANLMAGRTVQGASTLTQQLVKNFYLTEERTLERKLNEAYMAILLDLRYDKDEILTAYANEVYLGQDGSRGIHGFGLASQFYFNRDLDELGIPETAMLVAILKGPSEFNPKRRPERVLERRNLVIDLMAHHRIISSEEAAQAKAAALGLRDGGARPVGEYPAFIQLVRRQLQRDYREEDLRSEGLSIFTTLDPLVQIEAEAVVQERMEQLDKQRRYPPGTLETAVVVTSVAHGEVLALVGGRKAAFEGFNRALDALRSIGSLIKPVIYLAALSEPQRYSLLTSIPDRPVSLRVGGQLWQPQNYDRRVHGNVPLYRALARSFNLATVNLGLQLGVGRVADTLGTLGAVRKVDRVPALLLGATSLPPVEVAQVYQTIAAGGFRAPLRTIREVLDANGRPLTRYPLAIQQVVPADAAYLTQWALRQAVEAGTATWLKQRLPAGLTVAGKTGTTNDMRDSWFAGFSGDRVAVVWVGRDDNQPMGLSGSAGALRVWGDLMARIDNQPWREAPPEEVVIASACGRSGVPFSRGHVGRCGSASGSGTRTAAAPRPAAATATTATAEAPVLARDEPTRRESEPPPARERRAPRNTSPFMSDFYGN